MEFRWILSPGPAGGRATECNGPSFGRLVQHGTKTSAYQRIVRRTPNPHSNWTFLTFPCWRNRLRQDSQAENASSILVARSQQHFKRGPRLTECQVGHCQGRGLDTLSMESMSWATNTLCHCCGKGCVEIAWQSVVQFPCDGHRLLAGVASVPART